MQLSFWWILRGRISRWMRWWWVMSTVMPRGSMSRRRRIMSPTGSRRRVTGIRGHWTVSRGRRSVSALRRRRWVATIRLWGSITSTMRSRWRCAIVSCVRWKAASMRMRRLSISLIATWRVVIVGVITSISLCRVVILRRRSLSPVSRGMCPGGTSRVVSCIVESAVLAVPIIWVFWIISSCFILKSTQIL